MYFLACVGFNNTDIVDHNVVQVYSQADYDACNSNNNTGWTVNPADYYDVSSLLSRLDEAIMKL